MSDCKRCTTLVDTQAKFSSDMGAPVSDSSSYRILVGAPQYLTFTRLDISYVVQQLCFHMHDPVSPIALLRSASSSTSRAPLTMTYFLVAT
jgi:hypothetical protein